MKTQQLMAQGAQAHAEGSLCPYTDLDEVQAWWGGKWQAITAQELISEGLDLGHINQFVVGHSKDGSFSTLGHRATFDGRGFLSSYGKRCDCIQRVEPFDPHSWQHAEFVPFYAAAVRKLVAATA